MLVNSFKCVSVILNKKLIKRSIRDCPVLILGKIPTPDYFLDNWVFESFILANEAFAKALKIF